MKCNPHQLDSGHWHCCRCGYESKRPLEKAFQKECTLRLGDKVASGLAAFGITKARWRWVKSFFIAEQKCGCEKRQDALNQLGERIGL